MTLYAAALTQIAADIAVGVVFNICGHRQPIFRPSRAIELAAGRYAANHGPH